MQENRVKREDHSESIGEEPESEERSDQVFRVVKMIRRSE